MLGSETESGVVNPKLDDMISETITTNDSVEGGTSLVSVLFYSFLSHKSIKFSFSVESECQGCRCGG